MSTGYVNIQIPVGSRAFAQQGIEAARVIRELTDDDRTFLRLLGETLVNGANGARLWEVREILVSSFDKAAERLSQEDGE